MGNSTITIIDDVSNKPEGTLLPSTKIAIIATATSVPPGFSGEHTGPLTTLLSNSIFGALPSPISDLGKSAFTEEAKIEKVINLHRNFIFIGNAINSLFFNSTPAITFIQVGKGSSATISFEQNPIGTDYNAPVKDDVFKEVREAFTITSIAKGNESNQFKIELKADPDNINALKSLKISYIPPNVGGRTLTDLSLNDPAILIPKEINIIGFNCDRIVREFNGLENPFASYLQASETIINKKENRPYIKGDISVILNGHRLKDITQIKLTANPENAVLLKDQAEIYISNKTINKSKIPGKATIGNPKLKYFHPFKTEGDDRFIGFTNGGPISIASIPFGYTFDIVPQQNTAYTGKIADIEVHDFLDNNGDMIPHEHYVVKIDNSGLKPNYYAEVSEYIIDGLPKPIFDVGTLADTDINTISIELTDAKTEMGKIPASEYRSIIGARYIDTTGKSSEFEIDLADYFVKGSDEEKIGPNFSKVIPKILAKADAFDSFSISSGLRKIQLYTYHVGTGVRIWLDEQSVTWNNADGKYVVSNLPISIEDDVVAGSIQDSIGVSTGLTQELLIIPITVTPRILELEDITQLNSSSWYNYAVNGSEISFGTRIPSGYVLSGVLTFSHNLIKDVDYRVLSRGDNPGYPDDKIQLLLIASASSQFESITDGLLDIIYSVIPSLPGPTKSPVNMKGGSEQLNLSDEDYLKLMYDVAREMIPLVKPHKIYLAGITLDLHKKIVNPETGKYDLIPLNPLKMFGELIDIFNSEWGCSLYMDSCRTFILNPNDLDRKGKVDAFNYDGLVSQEEMSVNMLMKAYSTPNIRVTHSLIYETKTTLASGTRSNSIYTIPIPGAIINLVQSVIQNFNTLPTNVTFDALPPQYKSFQTSRVWADRYEANRLTAYAMLDESGKSKLSCISTPTLEKRIPNVAKSRYQQHYDDAIKLVHSYVLQTLQRTMIGKAVADDIHLDMQLKELEKAARSAFADSEGFLQKVTIKLFFQDKNDSINGFGTIEVATTFGRFLTKVHMNMTTRIDNR